MPFKFQVSKYEIKAKNQTEQLKSLWVKDNKVVGKVKGRKRSLVEIG